MNYRILVPIASILGVIAISMIVLKLLEASNSSVIQNLRIHDNNDFTKSVGYDSLTFGDRIAAATFSRIDDISFANLLVIEVATVILLLGNKWSPAITRIATFLKWPEYVSIALVFAVGVFLYLRALEGEQNKDYWGAFYCTSSDRNIKFMQCIEGILNLVFLAVGYIPAAIAFRFVNNLTRSTNAPCCHALNYAAILNCGLFVPLLLVSWIIFLYVVLAKVIEIDGVNIIGKPSSMAEMSITMAVSYSPYLLIALYAFIKKPKNYTLNWTTPIRKLVWIKLDCPVVVENTPATPSSDSQSKGSVTQDLID